MTGTIIIKATFSGDTLPSALSYDERLAGQSSLLQWLVPDASRLTLVDGFASVLRDRAMAAHDASQTVASSRPLLVADGGPPSASGKVRPCLSFNNARTDSLATAVVVPTGSGAKWTKICLVRPAAEPTSNTFHDMMSGNALSSSSVGIHRLAVRGVNTFHSRVGTSSNLAQASVAMTPDTWQLVMATWDGPTNTAKINVNGGAWATSTVAGAQCDNSVLTIGAVGTTSTYIGGLADAMFWTIDLSASANAALLATVKQYYRDRYGLTIG